MKKELIQSFCSLGAFKWDPKEGFRLASGKFSPYYIDCRMLLSYPKPRQIIAQLAFHLLKPLDIKTIGGLEIGAIPLATAISDYGYFATPRKEWRTFVVRKQPKDHGLGKRIEGAVFPQDQALIVDDVLTSGNSVIQAIEAAQGARLHVTHALVIVDREEQNGKQTVEAQNVKVLSLLTLEDLKKAYSSP